MLTEIVKPGPPWVATYKPSSSALSGDVELIAHEEHIPTQQKWALSLGAWVQYIEHGKQAVFATLPFLFTLDCPFFLGQRWIQEVIGQCQRQGDKTQMTRLFFGTAKRGTGSSVPAIIEEFRRDLRIADAVDRLVESGCRKQEAYRQVGAQFHLSENAVQAIYRKRRQFGYDPLAALLSPPQPTTEIPI